MKINKVADEKLAPSWAFGSKSLDTYEKNDSVAKSEVERLNATIASKVTEDVLSKECEAIEKCASSGKTYHYNSTWDKSNVDHLREYATACGIQQNKFKGINPSSLIKDIDTIEREAAFSTGLVKTASTDSETKEQKLVLDPFHFEERADTSHMEEEEWQKVSRQAKMSDAPTMVGGSVKPLRGGEDYNKNSEPKNAINQNSITNPNAIKEYAESEVQDTGARLKSEKQARLNARKESAKDWEKGIVASMEMKHIIPKGKVFPTESMVAQSGLNSPSSSMGVYAKFDPASIPDKTEGERIKDSKEASRNSIQRPTKEKAGFTLDKAATRSVSEVFGEELKKALGK